ncbi:unnamed protein product [Adineta ricciae]|uniref:Mos1 transposase HTH domain-containing protein n=1 Tax=Adineta ricciae TaxID=249248 RepID=A0A816FPN9_ADIRI|nr:unnamed protein product [Adineta ricciae]
MDKENFRFYIKERTALDVQPTIIHNELCTVFDDEAPSFRTVARWSKWFREGRQDIEDETRGGRPITETTSENIEQTDEVLTRPTGQCQNKVHIVCIFHLTKGERISDCDIFANNDENPSMPLPETRASASVMHPESVRPWMFFGNAELNLY